MSPLKSLVAAGTKLWLDSIDPEYAHSLCPAAPGFEVMTLIEFEDAQRIDDAVGRFIASRRVIPHR